MPDFKSLGVSKWLIDALNAISIYEPSDIQSACIPAILEGKPTFTKFIAD